MSHVELHNYLPLLIAVGCMTAGCGNASDGDLAEARQPFANGLGGDPVHEQITGEALSFLDPEVVLRLQIANVETDVELVLDGAHHYDACNFSGASQATAVDQAAAVSYLDPADDTLETDVLATLFFGRSLHIVQDFYAHSNWVELGASGLLDESLSAWPTLAPYSVLDPSGLVVVEGSPPAGTALWRHQGAPYPEDAIVEVQTRSVRRFGLISGTVDYEPINDCPPQVAMTHTELNKDRSTDPAKAAQHAAARALAVQQTAHEWCRLLMLTRSAWGDAGDRRLFRWVDDEAAASRCGDPGSLSVDITSLSPSPVDVGQDVTIQVAVANGGPATAYGARVHVTLAPGLGAETAVAGAGSCAITAAGDVACDLGALAPNSGGSITIGAVALAAGDQQVRAEIAAHVEDLDASDDTDVAACSVSDPPYDSKDI